MYEWKPRQTFAEYIAFSDLQDSFENKFVSGLKEKCFNIGRYPFRKNCMTFKQENT